MLKFLVSVFFLSVAAFSWTAEEKKEIQNAIRTYLKEHPEEVKAALEASVEIEEKDRQTRQSESVKKQIHKLEDLSSYQSVVFGPKDGKKVTLFLDPYCRYCHQSLKDFRAWAFEKKKYRCVLRMIPVLGRESALAIQALQATFFQNEQAFFQLMDEVQKSKKPLGVQDFLKKIQTLGLNKQKFSETMHNP